MNYASYEDVVKIVEGVAKKVPQGLMQGNTPVGTITWQYFVMEDYLALDGATINDASIQYPELLLFAKVHSLITTDTTKTYLFQYDETNDVLTMPNFMDKGLWSGSTVEEKEAGLPNIKDSFNIRKASGPNDIVGGGTSFINIFSSSLMGSITSVASSASTNTSQTIDFDASRSSSIYSDSVTTVQPPAIQLIPQIKYRNSTSVFNTVTAGRFVATAPAHYEREQLFTTNKTTITIYPTWVNVDNIGFVLEGQKTIDITNANNWDDPQYTTAANRAGKDFYIYAIYNSSANIEPEFILSANSTVPNGYTANNSRKIGGFHCLCLSVGTISGHTLSGYVTGDILPASPWDLKHRAISENEGMVYIPEVGKWVDIYLASWDGSKLVSQYNTVIADGASSPNFHGEKFVETFGLVNKQLPLRDDFVVFAKGSNEGTNIYGSSDPNTTGGHIDTNNRRMISNYGIEDCCGVLWQWSRNCAEYYPGAQWSSTTNQFLSGYLAQESSVYHAGTDAQKYGNCYGLLRRLRLGGGLSDGQSCGSRSAACHAFPALLDARSAARGASEPRTV